MIDNPPVTNPNLEGYTVVVNFWKHFWNSQKDTFTSPRPKCSGTYGDENKFNVWSVAVAAQAVVDGARIYPQELGPLIDPCMKALYRYRSPDLKGYCAVENFNGNRDIYYDDDAQVASALITAYEVTQNKEYLDRGRELVLYLMGGWNKDKGAKIQGGVLWHRDKPYISAISTNETALACLRLAKFIPNEANVYIKFAADCMDWLMDHLLDKKEYTVLDGIDKNSDGANGMKWTYNTGTALSACSLLYEFTQDEKWRHHANELAASATNKNKSIYCRDWNEHERRYWRDPSYFIQLLVEGLADYLLVMGDKAPESTARAIKREVERHMKFFRKYHYDQKDGLYFQMFEVWRLSDEHYELVKQEFGTAKKCDPNPEERAQEGKGSAREKPMVKTLIGSGAAARIWFQGARIVPEMST